MIRLFREVIFLKSSTKAKEKYNTANYDRLTIRSKKGKKEDYEKAAEKTGMSLNEFVISAVEEKMSRI